MKRLSIILILAMLLCGCAIPQEDLASKVEVKEYSCKNVAGVWYYVLFITNNSDKVLVVDANMTGKDKDGKPLSGSSDSVRIGSGQTAAVWSAEKIDNPDVEWSYDLDVKQSKYQSHYQDLKLDYNKTPTGVVATVTNNGKEDVEFVCVNVVYLKGGKMVDFQEFYCTNSDSKLPSGKSITQDRTGAEINYDDVAITVNCF